MAPCCLVSFPQNQVGKTPGLLGRRRGSWYCSLVVLYPAYCEDLYIVSSVELLQQASSLHTCFGVYLWFSCKCVPHLKVTRSAGRYSALINLLPLLPGCGASSHSQGYRAGSLAALCSVCHRSHAGDCGCVYRLFNFSLMTEDVKHLFLQLLFV